MELETFDNVYTQYSGHHWYGHAKDAADVNHAYVQGFWIIMLIIIGIPLLLVFPALLTLLTITTVIRFFLVK